MNSSRFVSRETRFEIQVRCATLTADLQDWQEPCLGAQAWGVIKSGLALVVLSCRSGLIHYNASSPSVRRGMFIDFTGAQAALRQEGHVCDPTECMGPGRQT